MDRDRGGPQAGALSTTTDPSIKKARHELGLSVREMADMLDTDASTVRKMEVDPSKATYRAPAPRMMRLVRAYLAGYRPADWPTGRMTEASAASGVSRDRPTA